MTGKEVLEQLNDIAAKLGVHIPGTWRIALETIDAVDQVVAARTAEASALDQKIAALAENLVDAETQAAARIEQLQEHVRTAEHLDADARKLLDRVAKAEQWLQDLEKTKARVRANLDAAINR